GAILVAPEPGDQTRSKLSYIIDRYVHLIRSFVLSWLYDNAEGESDAQSRGRAVLASAKEQAERLLHDVDNLVDRIKRK
ncbi:MAG: YtxH domain-containing protein, partial [Gammaproteobacteria bacterium]|nr:YtxH domain-containing protein [Gammaproteobacteria bacterium]